jgi:hypothetical protein
MSAIVDNIIKRLEGISPDVVKATKVIEQKLIEYCKSLGSNDPMPVRLVAIQTEDISDEEVEMQCIEYIMKQGASLKEAEEFATTVKETFDNMDARAGIKKERLLN